MTGKTRHQKIIGAGRGWYFLALLAIALTAGPIGTSPAEGTTECPIPRKENKALKQPEPNAAMRRNVRPPLDRITPVRTEVATFAMG